MRTIFIAVVLALSMPTDPAAGPKGFLSDFWAEKWKYQTYPFEMHWGYVDRLSPGSRDPSKLMAMDGEISISDGDPKTKEGIHLISALLFEHDGRYEEGRNDAVHWPGEDSSRVRWRSSTTDDWDGIAVRFFWEKGTNPTIRIATSQWTAEVPASRLAELRGLVEIGRAGQRLEMGLFFALSWKVYDLTLEWGYNPDGSPAALPVASWDGSMTLSEGGIKLIKARKFEGNGVISTRGELDPVVQWRSAASGSHRNRHAADGLAINVIAPKGTAPLLRIRFDRSEEEFEFPLPSGFRDVHRLYDTSIPGQKVHLHLHWCWFKQG
jgi:hypothetical protein